ncbi:hypothetical protein O181_092637 [Austropuccinia psidii MF-1]|uniref:Uncharacterized protein n=1 Tax=Austropuccinia psidii MF-1 TaxID=1389203 RepID=A0A9Q3P9S2_9BASI|nr:hypothetical protein [Austropuccinia psidii MF-1]
MEESSRVPCVIQNKNQNKNQETFSDTFTPPLLPGRALARRRAPLSPPHSQDFLKSSCIHLVRAPIPHKTVKSNLLDSQLVGSRDSGFCARLSLHSKNAVTLIEEESGEGPLWVKVVILDPSTQIQKRMIIYQPTVVHYCPLATNTLRNDSIDKGFHRIWLCLTYGTVFKIYHFYQMSFVSSFD